MGEKIDSTRDQEIPHVKVFVEWMKLVSTTIGGDISKGSNWNVWE